MIDMFVNKIVLYDDYFDIYFNTSDDENKNIKLDNPEDFEEIEKEQPSGSDCSHLVRRTGLEPVWLPTRPSNVRVCRFRHSRSTVDIITERYTYVNTYFAKI